MALHVAPSFQHPPSPLLWFPQGSAGVYSGFLLGFTRDSRHLRRSVKCVIMTHMRLSGLFRRSRDKVATPSDTADRLAELERAMKHMRLEWDDTYESLAKLVRKLSKREQRALQGESEQVTAPALVTDHQESKEELRARARALRGIR